jgi:hypothetical protein
MGNSSSSPPPPPPPQPVATITSGANTSTPTIVLNSVGTFNIVATASSSVNYTGTTLTSLPVKVFGDTPDIEFSPLVVSNSPYTYVYEKNWYEYTEPVASITNNTGQTLIYSIVTADSTTTSLTTSTVADIDATGRFLTTVSCGTFRICATADVTSNGDFDSNVVLSDILTIVKATPTILQYPQINLNITPPVTASTLVYGQPYTIIPDPSQPSTVSIITSNTDTNPYPNIIYKSSDKTVATISGSTVTIVGIGHFQILTTVSATTNYNQILASPSPQIYETIQAVPTITSFPTIPQQLVYGGTPYVIPSTITTSNTDIPGPVISYSSNTPTNATISGNTITVTGVVNGIGTGNYQILVTINATTNFSAVTYTYPSPTTYYQTIWATPIITFLNTFVTSSIYGSTYNFVAPILSNNDLSQTLTYSIVNSIPVVPSSTSVATIIYKSGVTNPSVVINSVGTFKIQASCLASDNSFYSPQTATSAPITIAKEKPNIVFNTSYFNTIYTCQPTKPYPLTNPIASITNNKVQSLTYSIVATDGVTPSTVATISSDGTSLTTNNAGSSFQILATATATSNGDYGEASEPSETITIVSGTPSITTFPTLPLNFTYGNTYPIPYTTTPPYTIITTNIDIPGPTITYSSSNTAVATISGTVICSPNSAISSITGTSITIVGVGSFQINVTIGATTNYNQATYVYPSPTTYYTSVEATSTISPFSSNFGSAWIINGTYNLTSTVTTNAGPEYTDNNPVIYSIINPSVSNIATITTSGSGSQITINDAGTFQIQASLAATPNFTSAVSVQSNTITIVTSNVSLSSNNFSNFVYGGGPYTLSVTTNNTDTNPAPTITYQIFPQSGSTGNGTINGNVLTITAAGGAYIYVNVTATQNFNSLNTCVYVYIAQATQVFSLNTNWLSEMYTTVTAGSSFYAYGAILSGSNNNTDPDAPTYSFQINSGAYIATLENGTINLIGPGSFSYSITAAATANFSAVTLTTSTFYVCVLPEIILFNNSFTTPLYVLWKEYGMVIGFPRGGYPYGFSDYTQVTIQINNNSNYSMQFNISQSISSGLYSIFLDSYNGPLARAWNKGFAGNVGVVGVGPFNGLIGAMLTGTISTVNFTFSGIIQYPTPTAPSSLSINWSSGNLQLAPNQIYGSYYAIAPNQSPFNFTIPQGMTIQNGSYTVLWPGYGMYQGNSLYAWGVSLSTNQNDYILNQPLWDGNNYYSAGPSANDNGYAPFGPNNNLYVGIPKILYNNY